MKFIIKKNNHYKNKEIYYHHKNIEIIKSIKGEKVLFYCPLKNLFNIKIDHVINILEQLSLLIFNNDFQWEKQRNGKN